MKLRTKYLIFVHLREIIWIAKYVFQEISNYKI